MTPPTVSPPARRERGQVLVVVALVLVALIGFAGLAIDGGNLYTEQRRAQAAADNAVMAAAFKQMGNITSTNTLRVEALRIADVNLYNNDGANNWVGFYRPPKDGPFAGNSEYMQVIITQNVQTMLIHFVYPENPVKVVVSAVAHGKSAQPFMQGFAIAAMNSAACGDNLFTARGGGNTGATIIKDGGIFIFAQPGCDASINFNGGGVELATTTSSSCPDINIPPDQPGGCVLDGAFPIQVTAGQAAQNNVELCVPGSLPSGVINWWSNSSLPRSTCNYYPSIQTNVPPPAVPPSPIALSDFTCGPNRTASGGTLQPGSYTTLNVGNADVVLSPGIYCITGHGGGGAIMNARNMTGRGVFIYIADPNAAIGYTGGTLDISAAYDGENGLNCTATPNDPLCNVQGIVIYKPIGPVAQCGTNSEQDISFGGTASFYVRGLIWAPQSYFVFGGGGDLYMTGQAITGCARYAGNGVMDITYNPDDVYNPPPSVQLDN